MLSCDDKQEIVIKNNLDFNWRDIVARKTIKMTDMVRDNEDAVNENMEEVNEATTEATGDNEEEMFHDVLGKFNETNEDVERNDDHEDDEDEEQRLRKKLKDALSAFRNKAESVTGGYESVKEHIVMNGRRYNERPLGKEVK